MTRPETLFVFRFGKFDGRYSARCISCDSNKPSAWTSRETWKGFVLDTGDVLDFSQSLTDCSGDEKGPASVYKSEPGLDALDSNDCIAVMCAQNYTFLNFDKIPDSIKSPFFISTVNPTKPASFKAEVEFDNPDVWSLPEPIDYSSQMQSNETDRWDSMLVPTASKTQLRLPTGIWFPATVTNGTESASVYSVLDWIDGKTALVDLRCSDGAVDIVVGTRISRRFKEKTIQLGTVKKSERVDSTNNV
jgi:hypothetical protein